MEPAPLPTQIHRYRIVRQLGRGSMGRVYLAEDPNTDRRIALKVLDPKREVDDTERERLHNRFLQEARAAGRLNHPAIVMVLDADTDPATEAPYIAMEWVDGQSLQEFLRQHGPLPADAAVSMAAKIGDALAYAHAHEVIHRDVKPANILISREGGVKLTDFGIAKLVSQSLTGTGTILGSPFYMSPEQVRGEPADNRSDLFSLGIVLYETLTGQPPFVGDTLAATTYKILNVDPRPVDLDRDDLPPDLVAVVQRTLEKDPGRRFQDAESMAAALRSIGQQPLAVDPDPVEASEEVDEAPEVDEVIAFAPLPPRRARPSARKYMTGHGAETLSPETRARHRPRKRRLKRRAELIATLVVLVILALTWILL
jgi:serine/threonine-protein kinase